MKLVTEFERKTFKHLYTVPSYLNKNELKELGGSIRILEIPSLEEFKIFCNTNTDFRSKEGNQSMAIRDEKANWAGTQTWDEFLVLLEKGDDKVIKSIKISTNKQVNELASKYKEILTNFKFDVTGQFFDIGLVLQGIPETWLEPENEEKEVIRIDVILNISLSASDDKNEVIRNASKVIAMSKILETHGIEVSIKGVIAQRGYRISNDENLITIMDIKRYDEPVNYQKLSILLSPAYFRRGIFKLMEVVSNDVRGGYGRPIKFKEFTSLSSAKSVNELEGRLFR